MTSGSRRSCAPTSERDRLLLGRRPRAARQAQTELRHHFLQGCTGHDGAQAPHVGLRAHTDKARP